MPDRKSQHIRFTSLAFKNYTKQMPDRKSQLSSLGSAFTNDYTKQMPDRKSQPGRGGFKWKLNYTKQMPDRKSQLIIVDTINIYLYPATTPRTQVLKRFALIEL